MYEKERRERENQVGETMRVWERVKKSEKEREGGVNVRTQREI